MSDPKKVNDKKRQAFIKYKNDHLEELLKESGAMSDAEIAAFKDKQKLKGDYHEIDYMDRLDEAIDDQLAEEGFEVNEESEEYKTTYEEAVEDVEDREW